MSICSDKVEGGARLMTYTGNTTSKVSTTVSGDTRHDPSPGQLQGILLPRGLLPAPGPQRLRVRAGVGAEGGYHGDPAAHRGPAPRLVH